MNKYIFLFLFLIIFIFIALPGQAVPFWNLSGGTNASGSIGIGNGYFDKAKADGDSALNDMEWFGLSDIGERNIYLAIEPYYIWIIEPIGYVTGISSATAIVHSSTGTLKYGFVATNGILYFTDSEGVKKKKANTGMSEATDTDILTGTVSLIYSGTVSHLVEFDGYIYFITSTGAFKRFSITSDIVQAVSSFSGGLTQDNAAIYFNNATSVIHSGQVTGNVLEMAKYNPNTGSLDYLFKSSTPRSGIVSTGLIVSSNFIYSRAIAATGGLAWETKFHRSNFSVAVENPAIAPTDGVGSVSAYQDMNLGGKTTIGMYRRATSKQYDVFDFEEVGDIGTYETGFSVAELDYDEKNIYSEFTKYGNNTPIKIYYKVIVPTNAVREIDSVISRSGWGLAVSKNYKWEVDILDPRGYVVGKATSDYCILNTLSSACSINSSFTFSPQGEWTNGTMKAKLYELSLSNGGKSLIKTSNTWEVENNKTIITTVEGQIPSETSLNIDNMVTWMGMGISTTSKILFAMIVIIILSMAGFVIGKGSPFAGMIIALSGYMFFLYIDYIPKWTVIILAMIIAIKTGIFR